MRLGLAFNLCYASAKSKKVMLEVVNPEEPSRKCDTLFAITGLEMNSFSQSVLCIDDYSSFKSMLVAFSAIMPQIKNKVSCGKRNGNNPACFLKNKELSIAVNTTRNFRLNFSCSFSSANLKVSDLNGYGNKEFSFRLRVDEIEDFEKCVGDLLSIKPEPIFTAIASDWVLPRVPLGVGIMGRHVGSDKLVVRAAMFSDMRRWISINIDKRVRDHWITLLNAINVDKVGVCIKCNGKFPKGKCWQKHCCGCHLNAEPTAVKLDYLDQLVAQYGAAHLGLL